MADSVYDETDMLMLSGIQHYMFCPRQWALIHIEQVWVDNQLTAQGQVLHKRVDDPFYRTTQRDKRMIRRMAIASKRLGLYGFADVIECEKASEKSSEAISFKGWPGLWTLTPVEYKRGRPKDNVCDIIQVVAQAICLEEIFSIPINMGAIYYESIKHRQTFEITDALRNKTIDMANQMHQLMLNKTLPQAEYSSKTCNKCSLYNLCLPKSFLLPKVKTYLDKNLFIDEEVT